MFHPRPKQPLVLLSALSLSGLGAACGPTEDRLDTFGERQQATSGGVSGQTLGQDEQCATDDEAETKCEYWGMIRNSDPWNACVNMMQARYYPTTPTLAMTFSGTLIGFGDKVGFSVGPLPDKFPLRTELEFEAIWGKYGALCMNSPRWPTLHEQSRVSIPTLRSCAVDPKDSSIPWKGNPFVGGGIFASYSLPNETFLRLARCPSCRPGGDENITPIMGTKDPKYGSGDIILGGLGILRDRYPARCKAGVTGCEIEYDRFHKALYEWKWCETIGGVSIRWPKCDTIITTKTVDEHFSSITVGRTYVRGRFLGYVATRPSPDMVPLYTGVDDDDTPPKRHFSYAGSSSDFPICRRLKSALWGEGYIFPHVNKSTGIYRITQNDLQANLCMLNNP